MTKLKRLKSGDTMGSLCALSFTSSRRHSTENGDNRQPRQTFHRALTIFGVPIFLLAFICAQLPFTFFPGLYTLTRLSSGKGGPILFNTGRRSLLQHGQPSVNQPMAASKPVTPSRTTRLLYIVTSSSLYYGKKPNEKQDRLNDILWPVVLEGVYSFYQDLPPDYSSPSSQQANYYDVDVYLLLGYTISPDRQSTLASQLPPGVGLEVWNDAEPFKVHPDTQDLIRAKAQLARQHRYVVKDKLPYYDFFVSIEDDMLVTHTHVEYHREIMAHLQVLKQAASDDPSVPKEKQRVFWGSLSRNQLERMRPGFVRTEVWLPENTRGTSEELNPRPVSHAEEDDSVSQSQSVTSPKELVVDPRPCCHHSQFVGLQGKRAPQFPNGTDLVVWETNAWGTSVRQMPDDSSLGWVALLPGPHKQPAFRVDGYWSGLADSSSSAVENDTVDYEALMEQSPKRITGPDYVANSAGWMSSSQEVLKLHMEFCTGGFVPPFDEPHYPHDGLPGTNVEFWSGGIQLWCKKCNMQRFLVLDPDHFSKHLLYHTANNKQFVIGQKRLVRVKDYLGQLHAAKRAARAYKRYKVPTLRT